MDDAISRLRIVNFRCFDITGNLFWIDQCGEKSAWSKLSLYVQVEREVNDKHNYKNAVFWKSVTQTMRQGAELATSRFKAVA